MGRIEVGRYEHPSGYAGWIHPEQDKGHEVPEWILYIREDGTVELGIRNDEDELQF